MRNSDAIAEESGGLLLAGKHTVNVAVSHITRANQRASNLTYCLFFIRGLLAGMDILYR